METTQVAEPLLNSNNGGKKKKRNRSKGKNNHKPVDHRVSAYVPEDSESQPGSGGNTIGKPRTKSTSQQRQSNLVELDLPQEPVMGSSSRISTVQTSLSSKRIQDDGVVTYWNKTEIIDQPAPQTNDPEMHILESEPIPVELLHKIPEIFHPRFDMFDDFSNFNGVLDEPAVEDPIMLMVIATHNLFGYLQTFIVTQLPVIAISIPVILAGAWPVYKLYTTLLANMSIVDESWSAHGTTAVITLSIMWTVYYLCIPQPKYATEYPYKGSKRVCVVGAGMSGLVSAKELIAEGHDVTVFERSDLIGGGWNSNRMKSPFHGGTWRGMISTETDISSSFSDFQFRVNNSHTPNPHHFTPEQFTNYLRAYIDNFGLAPAIQMDRAVKSCSRGKDCWNISTIDSDGVEATQQFDYLVVATGQKAIPLMRSFPGQEDFKGKVMHSGQFANARDFEGQRILIVGWDESTSQMATDLLDRSAMDVGNTVSISRTGNVMLQSRNIVANYRSLLSGSNLNRRLVIFTEWITNAWRTASWKNFGAKLSLMFNNMFTPFSDTVITSNACVPAISKDEIHIKPDIKRIGEHWVEFTDGSAQFVDTILMCSGYENDNWTLPSHGSYDNLFLGTIPIYQSGLAFVGRVNSQTGSRSIISEIQARYVAQLVSGRRLLPHQYEMYREITERTKANDSKYHTRNSSYFANYLARHAVGCEPDIGRVWSENPATFWKMMTGFFSPTMYRLRGPGAKPTAAYQALSAVPMKEDPGSIFDNLCVLLSGAVWTFYGRLPIVNKLGWLRPCLDRPY